MSIVDPPLPAGWLDPNDVAEHMKLPVGTDVTSLPAYCTAAEAFVQGWAHLTDKDDPKAELPDLYLAAILVAVDLYADRQTTGGVQSGGPDFGLYRLGDFSAHVQNLLDPYRKWSELFA